MIEPGIYTDLSNDDYHGEPDYLSSTRLKGYLPERYKPAPATSEALALGTLFHTVVLEPDTLGQFVVLDAEKIGIKSDGTPAAVPTMTVAWKKAVAEAEQDGKTVVAQADWDRVQRMADAVWAHEVAASLLNSRIATEESAFWVDEAGVRHKARFDARVPGAIVDLKSTSAQPGAESLTRAVINYGYDVSAAHYWAVAEGVGIDVDAFALIFVDKGDEPRVTVAELDDSLLERGRVLRALAIERHTNPAVPRYEGATGFLTLSAPRWAQIEEDIA